MTVTVTMLLLSSLFLAILPLLLILEECEGTTKAVIVGEEYIKVHGSDQGRLNEKKSSCCVTGKCISHSLLHALSNLTDNL